MTTLSVYTDAETPVLQSQLTDHAQISAELQQLGVELRRWPVQAHIQAGADADEVLRAYAEPIAALRGDYGFESVDVVSMSPDHPAREEARQKFLSEHTHADYEMRFFVAGAGMFYLHVGDAVYMLLCTAGDLISVPAGTRHWFDMSESPAFVAIRFFTSEDGWVAQFTGDPIADKYPLMVPWVEGEGA